MGIWNRTIAKMELGVFITTHLKPKYRHAGNVDAKIFDYYKYMINNYELPHGLKEGDVKVTIMDTNTGPYFEGYQDFIASKLANPLFDYRSNLVNKGGFTASLKYFMHTNPVEANQYNYFLFHIDDGVEVIKEGWAADLIEKYENAKNLGIMGRLVDKIRLGPTGLVDHRNCCAHLAKIWNIKEVITIPHLHGDWWMMNRDTLKGLAKVWFDPVSSPEAMNYFKALEDVEYPELVRRQKEEGGWPFDDMHIGREVDTSLRIALINKGLETYSGSKIVAKQLHHRGSNFRC